MVKKKKQKKQDEEINPKDTKAMMADEKIVSKIIAEKEYYLTSSQSKRQIWKECYKHYMSWMDNTKNPYLANLFIPKTHEAVELLAAFLAGTNQIITAEPEGEDDTKKAQIAEKLLAFQWRKVLNGRDKVADFIKQTILFGNGIIKLGWDMDGDRDEPFMEAINLPDIYMDFYIRDIQETAVIHRIIKSIDDVKNDKRYSKSRSQIITISDSQQEEKNTQFSAYDSALSADTDQVQKTELLEYWTKDNKEMITIGSTGAGWKILRRIDNPFKDSDGKQFKPFVKSKFKSSPLTNRAYDMGAIEPTLKLQQAFNDMINEIFDNVSLINNKQWIKRRGANINPGDMVRRPGGIITVDDINADIRSEEVSDIKASAIQMLSILDNEFQQASMVVNLLKAVPGANTATEAALGQQNVQTLLDLVDGNIKTALSHLGGMLLEIDMDNIQKKQIIKIFENENQIGFLEVEPKMIKGKFDVKIEADRKPQESKAVRQKQLLDFLAIISKDEAVLQQYPEARIKIYKKWLEEAGFSDTGYFFEEEQKQGQFKIGMPATQSIGGVSRQQGLTTQAVEQAAQSPLMQAGAQRI